VVPGQDVIKRDSTTAGCGNWPGSYNIDSSRAGGGDWPGSYYRDFSRAGGGDWLGSYYIDSSIAGGDDWPALIIKTPPEQEVVTGWALITETPP
jgi:hypothetical protein